MDHNTETQPSIRQAVPFCWVADMVKSPGERRYCLKSLKENIDTSTPTGRLVFHIFGALSEFERSLIVERTRTV
jgi:DNA invertase Pin-like site-specific DNA recombinase